MATYTGTAGNNALTGTSAGDTFVWSAGADTITGGGGFDRLDYRTFTLAITADFAATAYTGTVIKSGGNGTDTFTGIQTILGGSGNDTLSGSTDATPGLPAAVNMQGGAGNDVIDGRSSQLNLVMYSDATSGVTLNMATGTATGGGVGTDSLVDVRRAEGSGFNDTMTGSAFNDTFNHSGGSDTYDGGAGFNLMNYSRGTAFSVTVTALAPGAGLFGLPNETVVKSFGGTDSLANFNLITGSAGADTFLGVITNYTFLSYGFRPGFGNDTINGQSSTINRADYSDALGAVTV